eukprot:590083_1
MPRYNHSAARVEKSKEEKDKDEERRQRYKALRAKVKAQTQQTAKEFKLTSKKRKKRDDYKLTAKSVAHKQKKKRKKKTNTAHKRKKQSQNTAEEQKLIHGPTKEHKSFANAPYYLNKHAFEGDINGQSECVNDFQKNKYKELLRLAQQTEWEYTLRYVRETYGERANSDYTDIFENIHIDFDHMMVTICIQMLLILHESWSGRIQIISALVDQLCAISTTNDEFALKMCTFLFAIGVQFSDSRSLVIQAMKRLVHRICSHKPQLFLFFAPYLIHQISQTWPIRIQALREAGEQLAQSIVFVCLPFDDKRVLLFTMFELMKSRHAAIRTKSAEYICVSLHHISRLEQLNPSEEEEHLLDRLENVTTTSLNDASSSVRQIGYKMLFKLTKIAPNTFNNIVQTLSKAKIKKFYEANGLKAQNVLDTMVDDTDDKEDEEEKQHIQNIKDYNFNMSFEDRRTQPRDLETRIKDVFVDRDTKIQNKRDKSVLFKDLVSAERIGIHNHMPLLTLLNDVFVRCKMKSNYNKLFNVDYFMSKYALDKALSDRTGAMLCSALKQFQYMFPLISNHDKNWINIKDDGQVFLNYTIGFLRFMDEQIQSRTLVNIKQFDLVIIPQRTEDEEAIHLRKVLKRSGLKHMRLPVKDDHDINGIYGAFCRCFKDIEKEIGDRHVVFVVDRSVCICALIVNESLAYPFSDIMIYPEFHIGKSKHVLFGRKQTQNRKAKRKKKAIKAGIGGNGILSDMRRNRFVLFCHILNTDCVRLYLMMHRYLSRFVPHVDMMELWPKLFETPPERYELPKEIPVFNDKQFAQFYEMVTHDAL